MTTVTHEQARQRFVALPLPLQEAIFSVETADIINSIGEKFDFEDAAVSDVAEVVGLSLMGFIHPDTVKQEISDRVETSEESLAGVTMQVQDRILNRFRGLLVNAFYSEPGKSASREEAPMPLGEISSTPATQEPAPKEKVAVKIKPKKINFSSSSVMSTVQSSEKTSPDFLPPETSTPDMTFQQKFSMENIQASPAAENEKKSELSSPADELETAIPSPSQEAASAAPFILHEEAGPEPALGEDINISSAFGVDSGDQFQKESTSSGSSEKPKAAQMQFGNTGAASTVDYSASTENDETPPAAPQP